MSNNILTTISSVIVQGITGNHGSFHTRAMKEYGTPIVAGTSPTKAGTTICDVPVYSSIADIKQTIPVIDATVIFVPPAHTKAAIFEAIDAEISLIVCITEGIPIHDMLLIRQRLNHSNSQLIGPNSPGIIVPGHYKLGIIPTEITLPGSVGIVSRSGTLTYETIAELTRANIGQYAVIGIGGDPIKGMSFVDCLEMFENTSAITDIVLIGEIGGQSEEQAADYIRTTISKPITGYIAGMHAPMGVQMGHAGAILATNTESASHKRDILRQAGVSMCESVTEIAATVRRSQL